MALVRHSVLQSANLKDCRCFYPFISVWLRWPPASETVAVNVILEVRSWRIFLKRCAGSHHGILANYANVLPHMVLLMCHILKHNPNNLTYLVYQPTLKDSECNLQTYWLQSTKELWSQMKTTTVSSDALKTKFYESFNTETQPSVGEKCNALRFGKQKEIFSPGWQGRCTRVVECGPSVLLHHILASRERHIYYGATGQKSPGIIRAALSIGEIKLVSLICLQSCKYNSFVTPTPLFIN